MTKHTYIRYAVPMEPTGPRRPDIARSSGKERRIVAADLADNIALRKSQHALDFSLYSPAPEHEWYGPSAHLRLYARIAARELRKVAGSFGFATLRTRLRDNR